MRTLVSPSESSAWSSNTDTDSIRSLASGSTGSALGQSGMVRERGHQRDPHVLSEGVVRLGVGQARSDFDVARARRYPRARSEMRELHLRREVHAAPAGALIDYYFVPRGGFHILGSLGFAQLAVTGTEDDDYDYPSGTYWMLGFGHEWWAADSASFGALASVTDGSLEVQERTTVDVELLSFGLALTATSTEPRR